VLIGQVVRDDVEQDPQAEVVRLDDHRLGIRERAEYGLDRAEVRHVVVGVLHRRRVPRVDPDRVNAEVGEVRQSAAEASDVTNAVTVAVREAADVDLVMTAFKEGRALRTETTVNDPYDFGIGRLLTAENWNALMSTAAQVNQRLLDAQLAACDCAPDSITLQRIVSPSVHDGLKAPALRFGDQRVMALLSCLCAFRHLFAGITNASLRELVAGLIPGYSARQMTYDRAAYDAKASSAGSPKPSATS
jgi:hypothetical protein